MLVLSFIAFQSDAISVMYPVLCEKLVQMLKQAKSQRNKQERIDPKGIRRKFVQVSGSVLECHVVQLEAGRLISIAVCSVIHVSLWHRLCQLRTH